MSSKSTYFPALTGVRALAAFGVFIYHYNPIKNTEYKWIAALIDELHIGVPIFFVLSGFLITYRYVNKIEGSWSWAKKYLQNRFARIYPVYFILTAFTFIVLYFRPELAPTDWLWTSSFFWKDKLIIMLLNFTMLRAYFDQIKLVGLPTAWSLTVEETFYLCAPFILLNVKIKNWRLLPFAIFFISIGLLLVKVFAGAIPYGFMADVKFMLEYTFFGRVFEFIIGIGLALWMMKNYSNSTNRPFFTLLGVVGIFLCLVAMAVVREKNPMQKLTMTHLLINNLVLPWAVVAFFKGLITEESWLRTVLEMKVFDKAGKYSYIFYLVHLGIINEILIHSGIHSVLIKFIVYAIFVCCALRVLRISTSSSLES